MITELTKEQLAKMPEYVEKWLKIGLSTADCNRKEAEEAVCRTYEVAGLNRPKLFIWTNDPIEGAMAKAVYNKMTSVDLQNSSKPEINEVAIQVWDKVWDKARYQVLDKVLLQLRYQVRDKVIDELWGHVRDQLSDQVMDQSMVQLWRHLSGHVRAQVSDQVRAQVKNQVWDNHKLQRELRESIQHQIYGAQDASFLSFYDYCLNELAIKECKKLQPLMDLAKNCGWWAPYEGVCFMQEKPKTIHMVDGVLHAEGEPAISYRGDSKLKVWSLWGVSVPQWLAETDVNKLDIQQILAIKNADERAIGLKRYGAERLISDGYGRVMDDQWETGKYKLIDLSELFQAYDYAPHLYMANPSVPGLIHCEGVPPSIKTVKEALEWRESREGESFEKVVHT